MSSSFYNVLITVGVDLISVSLNIKVTRDKLNAPYRVNAKGEIGVEINYNGEQRFMVVPNLAKILKLNGIPEPRNVEITKARPIVLNDFSTQMLRLDDPNVVKFIKDTANNVENAGNFVAVAAESTATIGTGVSAFTAAGTMSLGSLSLAFLGAAAIVLATPETTGDASMAGFHKKRYKEDVAKLTQDSQLIQQLLNSPDKLSVEDRKQVREAIDRIKALREKWEVAYDPKLGTFNPKHYYDSLPLDQKMPWGDDQIVILEKKLNIHP